MTALHQHLREKSADNDHPKKIAGTGSGGKALATSLHMVAAEIWLLPNELCQNCFRLWISSPI